MNVVNRLEKKLKIYNLNDMKVIGIIVEYNPLHNGHIYQLNKIKKIYGENSIIIVLMSGNLVQRGEFAIENKFIRAEKALNNEVDIVLEIPPHWTLNSADKFAEESVRLINKFGITDLVFGSDTSDIDKLKQYSEIISSSSFDKEVKKNVKEIQSYPKAVEKILNAKLEANDIFAITYMKWAKIINPKIKVNIIKRKYSDNIISASEIRKKIINKDEYNNYSNNVENYIDMDLFVKPIKLFLTILETSDNVLVYIKNNIVSKEQTWDEFLSSLANKSFTKKFIARAIMRSLLKINSVEVKKVRLLGLTKNGSSYLAKYKDLIYSKYDKSLFHDLKIAKTIDSIVNLNQAEIETKQIIIKK